MSLKNKKVIIAGLNKDVGPAMAYFILKNGGEVCINSRSENSLIRIKAMLSDYGKIEYVTGEPSSYEKALEIINKCVKLLRGLDHLVINFGSGIEDSIEDPRGLNEMIETYLYDPIYLVRAALQYLKSGSSIIFLIPIFGIEKPSPDRLSHSITTASLSKLVEVLAQELLYREIRVVGIAYGDIDPGFVPGRDWKSLRKLGSPSAPPEDYASIATTLLSEDLEWINGTVIIADGGFRLRR